MIHGITRTPKGPNIHFLWVFNEATSGLKRLGRSKNINNVFVVIPAFASTKSEKCKFFESLILRSIKLFQLSKMIQI